MASHAGHLLTRLRQGYGAASSRVLASSILSASSRPHRARSSVLFVCRHQSGDPLAETDIISGHSNGSGSSSLNQSLSPKPSRRADDRLHTWGYGITNLVAAKPRNRHTERDECAAGIEVLRAKVRRHGRKSWRLLGGAVPVDFGREGPVRSDVSA